MVDLTPKDRAMRDGQHGPLIQFAMSLVLRAAEIWRAPHLIDASFAHVDACHYAGRVHLDFARKLEAEGATFPIPVWTNTLSVALADDDGRDASDPRFAAEAREAAQIYERIGCKPVWTCAPYQLPGGPGLGDQIIGSESNAVAYYNAVTGARTQKYGDFLDVACALTGRVPYAGLHTDAGRLGAVEFQIAELSDDLLRSEEVCHLIGYVIGRQSGTDIPVLSGLPAQTPEASLKGMAAAGGASGGVTMFHVLGVTPEAPDRDTAFGGRAPKRVFQITEQDLRDAKNSLSTARSGPLDMVALGTPHFSYEEFQRLAALIDGQRVNGDTVFYVSTSRFVKELAAQSGALASVEAAGVEVLSDTCTYFSPAVRACRGRVMTNSAKWAYYAPGMLPVEVAFGSLEDCVASAVKGEIVLDQGVRC